MFFNRKLVPDADKGSPIGIKTQRITELGESAVLDMDIQFDATDIEPRGGEIKVRGDDGKWAVRTNGNSDLSEFDPSVKSSSSWDKELSPLCGPCWAFEEVTDPQDVPESLSTCIRDGAAWLRKRETNLKECIAQHKKDRAAAEKKFRKKKGDEQLHYRQTSQLCSFLRKQSKAEGLLARVASYLRLVESADLTDVVSTMSLARLQPDLVLKVSRALRTPANHLMVVMLQDIYHRSWRCIARFFYDKLSNKQAWLMVDAVTAAVKKNAPKITLRNIGADGEHSKMRDGRTTITNLSQLANTAIAVHEKFTKAAAYKNSKGLVRLELLRKRWVALVQGCSAPPRRAAILGMRGPMTAQERETALAAYAGWRRKRRPKRAFHRFIEELCSRGETTESVLYSSAHNAAIPADERIILDALCALQSPAEPLIPEQRAFTYPEDDPYVPIPGLNAENAAVDETFHRARCVLRARRARAGGYYGSADVLEKLEEACKRAEMDKLRAQRPEFNSHYYSPEKVDGRPRSLVECPDHKLKNFGQGVTNQALSTEAGYDVAGRYWWPLERERCLATAKEKHIAAEAVLLRAVDKQSDLVWRAFVVDESFKQSLLDDGHISDVLVLDVIGELFESFNMPGLTAVEREIRRFHLAFLNFCLWGEDLFLPLKHYGEAFKKRRGLVPNNLLAMHANSDAIGCLLASLPEETRKGYCEACQSNVPSLESFFSSLVTKTLHKPAASVAEGALVGVDALASLKMDPTRQFYLHASRSKRYDYQSLTNMALPHWNSGFLLDPTCADYKAWVQDFVSRAENKLERRVATVREHHKIKP